MWTIAVSGKKKLRIQKYPDMCGRGLIKEHRFNRMYDKFRFDGDFFVRNLDANVERSTRRGKRPRRTADDEIAEGVWPNQEPLLLSARLFFFFWQNGPISFFFGPVFFPFLYPRTFFCF